ncbi:H/ACA ribonucleoprotein complex subunit 3, putative (NOP10) [Plasmodium ovale curtisi]|uniref:H/ACA ribonucleoprotein complex subunit 3, putative (NOP10) n=1 Tax=Plasmodium ovale curtisi TaxID=864141 RepID=A0A1A8WWZ6_PLAOA|nr:H/ACA ribonucleoprotein complex subunit 3, putative (NOP10) [Plasmodium ovale curtisi]
MYSLRYYLDENGKRVYTIKPVVNGKKVLQVLLLSLAMGGYAVKLGDQVIPLCENFCAKGSGNPEWVYHKVGVKWELYYTYSLKRRGDAHFGEVHNEEVERIFLP